MNPKLTHPATPDRTKSIQSVLETVAAGVLLLVLAALVWMVLAAYWPGTFRVAAIETEVIVVLALLTAALLLVSVVALLHTRSRPGQ